MKSDEFLYTKYGLRSLSKSDVLYNTGENYWKGPIWVNFNYLVLRAMKVYYWDSPQIQEFYPKLKENLVENI